MDRQRQLRVLGKKFAKKGDQVVKIRPKSESRERLINCDKKSSFSHNHVKITNKNSLSDDESSSNSSTNSYYKYEYREKTKEEKIKKKSAREIIEDSYVHRTRCPTSKGLKIPIEGKQNDHELEMLKFLDQIPVPPDIFEGIPKTPPPLHNILKIF